MLVVDTSIWVEFFRGAQIPDLETALQHGLVLLAPIVAAELLSAPIEGRRRADLEGFLQALPLHPTSFEHWSRVGDLRARLARRGLSISTPDAHVAQCALDVSGCVWSGDAVFARMEALSTLRVKRP